MKIKDISRRQFIGASAATVAGLVVGTRSVIGAPAIIKNLGKPNSVFGGVQIGAITYSYRSMPDQSAEATLKYVVDSGISAIELMGNVAETFAGAPAAPPRGGGPGGAAPAGGAAAPGGAAPGAPRGGGGGGQRPAPTPEQLAAQAARAKETADWRASVSMEKFEQLRKMYKDAGVSIFAWKPSALGANNTDAEIDYAMRAAKALGATSVTLEFPPEGQATAQTKRLGDIAAKHKIYVAYHAHLQSTPTLWDEAIAQSAYNAMNLDIGHYTAAGLDALAEVVAKHDHITDMHTKDRKNKANGGENQPWGQGDTPIVQVLQTMKKNKWKFPSTIELEYTIPEGSDAVKETAKCVEYARKALEA